MTMRPRLMPGRTDAARFSAAAPYVVDIPFLDPLAAGASLRDTPWTLLLHGAGEQGRWSFLATDPLERIEVDAGDGRRAFEAARSLLQGAGAPAIDGLPPFTGGIAGLIGYEMARAFDVAPAFQSADATPDLALGLYDRVAAFDHLHQRACVIGWDLTGQGAGATRDRARQLAERLAARQQYAGPTRGAGFVAPFAPLAGYEAMVAQVVARVRAGDLYQANVARRYEGALAADDHPYALFQRLCSQSPAPFGAYMRLDRHAIVSNSPERFVSVTRKNGGFFANTKPIKGTRPRGDTPERDRANARDLLASEKDRAENLMIVDLMRNDLSKVSAPGSVHVPALFKLESYANVHHLVSEVESRLRDDASAFDLFAGAFPPGSITGAPKVKAMELIGALEGVGRGPYCGSLAWFGFDGAMDSSVLIRTATCWRDGDGWRLAFNVGAGIVADSNPTEEALETIAKAAALKRAIMGHVEDEA